MKRSTIFALAAAVTVIGAATLYLGSGGEGEGEGTDNAVAAVDGSWDPSLAMSGIKAPENTGNPADLSALVREEPRDAAWAGRSEAAIQASMNRVPFMDVSGPLDIRCSTSVCEVSGSAPDVLQGNDLGQYWGLLQSAIVQKPLAKNGLEMAGASYGRPGNPHAFIIYFRRGE